MIQMKLQYDAQTRTLKLVDQDLNTILESGPIYDFGLPLSPEEVEELDLGRRIYDC